ncbi:FkbM family methyltransferase, partial [Pseudomonas viridiflava]|uniref:FkbM family methyltransferase n=1 Tax=Pseudomonas viridiflava TaxID=33069 RepID=UPI0013D2AF71
SCIEELGTDKIDLMKINIEGGEFEVLPALIDAQYIYKITNLQIQFHDSIEHAKEKRDRLRDQFKLTHQETWNYEFVWENWKLKGTTV